MSPLSLPISLCATLTALTAFDPPVLPFTELSDKKIQMTLQHMAAAPQCTPTDMNVVLQLDHIHWKYAQMRDVLYKAAQDSADGSTVNAKDLGKLFDRIDASLEADREQSLERIRENFKRQEAEAKAKGKEI
jgi:hypothetical protein